MFCRNCGKTVAEQAVVCVACGCPPRNGANFCQSCGEQTAANAAVCIRCGVALSTAKPIDAKSKLAAGLLGIFLGGFGVHRFYLGYIGIGIAQVAVTVIGGLITCGLGSIAGWIWGITEGIVILAGGIDKDAQGRTLKE